VSVLFLKAATVLGKLEECKIEGSVGILDSWENHFVSEFAAGAAPHRFIF